MWDTESLSIKVYDLSIEVYDSSFILFYFLLFIFICF